MKKIVLLTLFGLLLLSGCSSQNVNNVTEVNSTEMENGVFIGLENADEIVRTDCVSGKTKDKDKIDALISALEGMTLELTNETDEIEIPDGNTAFAFYEDGEELLEVVFAVNHLSVNGKWYYTEDEAALSRVQELVDSIQESE